jgi:hypothetical protein
VRAACLVLFVGVAVPIGAQTVTSPPRREDVVSRALIRLRNSTAWSKASTVDRCRPSITQFGWQFEKQFYSKDSGIAP